MVCGAKADAPHGKSFNTAFREVSGGRRIEHEEAGKESEREEVNLEVTPLNPSQKEAIKISLNERRGLGCKACGGGNLMAPSVMIKVGGPENVHMVPLACTSCAQYTFFDVKTLGLI